MKTENLTTMDKIPDDVFKEHVMPAVCENLSLKKQLQAVTMQADIMRKVLLALVNEMEEDYTDMINMSEEHGSLNASLLEYFGIDSYMIREDGESVSCTYKLVEEKIVPPPVPQCHPDIAHLRWGAVMDEVETAQAIEAGVAIIDVSSTITWNDISQNSQTWANNRDCWREYKPHCTE